MGFLLAVGKAISEDTFKSGGLPAGGDSRPKDSSGDPMLDYSKSMPEGQ